MHVSDSCIKIPRDVFAITVSPSDPLLTSGAQVRYTVCAPSSYWGGAMRRKNDQLQLMSSAPAVLCQQYSRFLHSSGVLPAERDGQKRCYGNIHVLPGDHTGIRHRPVLKSNVQCLWGASDQMGNGPCVHIERSIGFL